MNRYDFTLKPFICLAIAIFLFVAGGCAPKARAPVSTLDTPDHHVFSGMKLLEKGKLSDAEREFNLAKELDHKYSPAYRGLGLVAAYKGDFKPAFKNMDKAEDLAKTKKDKALAYVGYMRVYTMRKKGDDWIEDVEKSFKKANKVLKKGPKMPDPHFYMGVAYKEAYKFTEAGEQFRKVLDMDKGFVSKADTEYKLVQKIERAMPGTTIGKKVALLNKVKRVDVAALFIQEMKLDKIYEKFRPQKFDTRFKAPGQSTSAYQMPVPADVVDHPLRTDVQTVVALKIKGLETFPNGTFSPNENITKASFAMMIADVIATISHDSSLSTKYIGSVSPFADVRNDVPYFNAIMVCTTRGIIEPKKGLRQNIFDPMANVSGADSLLIIRRVKEDLKIF